MVYCVESKETFDSCICEWAYNVARFFPNVPVILVGALHCYRYNFDDQTDSVSTRCISEEEGEEAARRIGMCYTKHFMKHIEVAAFQSFYVIIINFGLTDRAWICKRLIQTQ